MKGPAIIIPFKGQDHKSRLAPMLDEPLRRELACLLLRGVLRAVKQAGLQRRCFVVSSDPSAGKMARRSGASFVTEEKDAGVNSAVRAGLREAHEFERLIVIPSDLPHLSPEDVNSALELGEAKEFVIAPSRAFNGTNLLFFTRARPPQLSFDQNSFWNHLASAASRGLSTGVLTRQGILFDLDSPDDVGQMVSLGLNAEATRFIRRSSRR
ncbi:MAG: 2-phospho-L-lactate guanylyltransferase [Nitrososphaerales archaeon]|nr:2-phospho-L-lactate guanylyltransferase [Nitrososphaerales archaeon]